MTVRHVLDINGLLKEYFRALKEKYMRVYKSELRAEEAAAEEAAKLPDTLTIPELVDHIVELRKDEHPMPPCFGAEFWPLAKNCRKCMVAPECQKYDYKWRPKAISKKQNPDALLMECEAFTDGEDLEAAEVTPENKFRKQSTANPDLYKGLPDDDRIIALSFRYYDLAKKWPDGYHLVTSKWEIYSKDRHYLTELVGAGFYAHYFTRAQLECLCRRGFGHKKYTVGRIDIANALAEYSSGRVELASWNPSGYRMQAATQKAVLREALKKIHGVWKEYRRDEAIHSLIAKYGYPVTITSRVYKGKQHIVELREEGVFYVAYVDIEENKKYDVEEKLFPTLGMCAHHITQEKKRIWSGKRFFELEE